MPLPTLLSVTLLAAYLLPAQSSILNTNSLMPIICHWQFCDLLWYTFRYLIPTHGDFPMYWSCEVGALQMKGRDINVCFPFMYHRNETVQPPYFQNRIIMFCLPFPTLLYL